MGSDCPTGWAVLQPHVHSREEEGFFILEGEITFTVNEEKIVAKAGTFANMPVGHTAHVQNESSQTAKMLISIAPAGLEQISSRLACRSPRER